MTVYVAITLGLPVFLSMYSWYARTSDESSTICADEDLDLVADIFGLYYPTPGFLLLSFKVGLNILLST